MRFHFQDKISDWQPFESGGAGDGCRCTKPQPSSKPKDAAAFASLWRRLTPARKLETMNAENKAFWGGRR